MGERNINRASRESFRFASERRKGKTFTAEAEEVRKFNSHACAPILKKCIRKIFCNHFLTNDFAVVESDLSGLKELGRVSKSAKFSQNRVLSKKCYKSTAFIQGFQRKRTNSTFPDSFHCSTHCIKNYWKIFFVPK